MRIKEELFSAYKSIESKIPFKPDVAIVLGSGLGDFADCMENKTYISYGDIEGFPVSTVVGHKGRYAFGNIGNVNVVAMQGRVHHYEGYEMGQVVLPIRLMKLMGAKILLLTNACGGLNPGFKAGDFMMIKDQISVFVPNPLIGENIDELGTRFPDMSHVYDIELQNIIRQVALENDIDLKEGVYCQFTGPSFESPAEIKMAGIIGADAVGMSTAVEATAANHMGMKICGISFVSNLAAGISKTPLTHEEVQEAANIAAPKFKKLITSSVEKFKNIL